MILGENILLHVRGKKSYTTKNYFFAIRLILILNLNFFIFALCDGCFFIGGDRYEDITVKPSQEWSSTDNLTVLISPVAHNLYDQDSPNVKVIATPYYPSMILAINKDQQRIRHLSEDQFRANTDTLMADALGMFIDWKTNKIVDARGNYVKSPLQFDSLMFLINISNRGWRGNVPVQSIGKSDVPIMRFSDWPIYMPDIIDIEKRIFLVNDNNEILQPRFVWGRKRDMLTMDETLFVRFVLRQGSNHFLKNSETMYIVVKGLENEVKLLLPVSLMH